MIKRAAGMFVVSAVLCGAVTALTPAPVPQDNGSAQEKPVMTELVPSEDTVTYEAAESTVGTVRAIGLKDTLTPASDYGHIFPYAAQLLGWKEDGTAVYQYALADEAGEYITNPVYTAVEHRSCGEGAVWLLESETAEDGKRVSCAAEDGRWVVGPVSGSITVEDGYIFVHRADSPDTEVYRDGKLLHNIAGSMMSCADGVVVSRKTTDTSDIWHIYDADTLTERTTLTAYQIGTFSDGYASMQISENQWAVVDKDGVITPFSDAVWMDEVCNGYVLVKNKEGRFGVSEVSGQQAVAFTYVDGTHCSEDYPLYQLWESETECLVISANKGQKLELPEDLKAQKLLVLPNNYFAYVDAEGCSVVFDDLKHVALEGEAVFYTQGGACIGAMADGYQIFDLEDGSASRLISYRYIVPAQDADKNSDAFTIADLETGLQGIGTIRGRMVLQPEYDSISGVGGSYYMAVRNGWSGIVDARGRWIVCTQLSGVK